MGAKFRSVFNIIGPTMIGPSSSHTAGAVASGRAAYKMVLSEKLLFITTNHLLRPIVAMELTMQLLRVSRTLPLMILVCQEPLNLLVSTASISVL